MQSHPGPQDGRAWMHKNGKMRKKLADSWDLEDGTESQDPSVSPDPRRVKQNRAFGKHGLSEALTPSLADLSESLRQTLFVVLGPALRCGSSLLIDVCHAQPVSLCSINILPELITGVSEGPCHVPRQSHIWFLTTVFMSPESGVFTPSLKKESRLHLGNSQFLSSASLLHARRDLICCCSHFIDKVTEAWGGALSCPRGPGSRPASPTLKTQLFKATPHPSPSPETHMTLAPAPSTGFLDLS